MPTTHPEPTTYSRDALEIKPTSSARYLPAYPWRVVHWYRTRPGLQAPLDGCETLGHYRTRDEAEQALQRFTRPE